MNYLGHAHVAVASGWDDPRYVLGAVLPDLASMAGVRVHRGRLEGTLAAGVRCHVTTDAVFHAHPTFRRGAAAIRQDLAVAGLASGPARAAGHVGWELLLDGTLLGSPTEEAYWRALELGEEVHQVIDGSDHRMWRRFLAHRDRRPALRYDDADWVADRVHDVLARRPRLRVAPGEVRVVARVLDSHAGEVRAAAGDVLDHLVRSLH